MRSDQWWRIVTVVMLAVGVQSAAGESDKDAKKIIDASQTGSEHRGYKKLAGEFDQKIKWWPTPESEPLTGEAVVNRKRILGVRFLSEKGKGHLAGTQYDTLVIYGYDNATKEHTAVWMSTFGTQMLDLRGTYEASTMTYTFKGSYTDAVSGEKTDVRMELKLTDRRGNSRLEIFYTPTGGKEFKTFEIESKRKVRRSA